ncbi:MAG TPA: hypothetical protein VEH27_05875 [Methylomirabilota bacterium]|nr:hypothetical protein [Methylomirabilota bacterium]
MKRTMHALILAISTFCSFAYAQEEEPVSIAATPSVAIFKLENTGNHTLLGSIEGTSLISTNGIYACRVRNLSKSRVIEFQVTIHGKTQPAFTRLGAGQQAIVEAQKLVVRGTKGEEVAVEILGVFPKNIASELNRLDRVDCEEMDGRFTITVGRGMESAYQITAIDHEFIELKTQKGGDELRIAMSAITSVKRIVKK